MEIGLLFRFSYSFCALFFIAADRRFYYPLVSNFLIRTVAMRYFFDLLSGYGLIDVFLGCTEIPFTLIFSR